MANLRDFKKDIAAIANDFVTTLCVKNSINGCDDEKTSQLIVKALSMKAEFIKKVNSIEDPHDAKKVKAYFNTIKKDLINQANELAKEINEL